MGSLSHPFQNLPAGEQAPNANEPVAPVRVRGLIKLVEKARTGNPIGVRAEDAFVECGPIRLFLSEFPLEMIVK